MKKGISICLAVALLGCAIIWLLFTPTGILRFSEEKTNARFRALDKKIQIMHDGDWKDFEVIGVNIGTGYPGVFPNENGIDEDTYYRWFEMIAEMNANTVRVYKIQPPSFYSALYRYNESHTDKLYLIQGADFSDHLMFSEENILEPNIMQELMNDTHDLIDALHGKQLFMDFANDELHCYCHNVSEYVLGYILGVEWDEIYVEYICQINPSITGYTGEYLYCDENANGFEVFLAQWGNEVLRYEDTRYNQQKMISFCNWALTDPFINEHKWYEETAIGVVKDTEATIDLENIHITENVKTGLFAAYNVYPYFPLFLQYGAYTEYVDDSGNRNPYRKYLMELVQHHSYPVIISEYGIPASRSKAYGDMWRGMNHGGLTEKEQGEALLAMFEDIKKADCAGSIVFSWQDEWYKSVWNERKLSDPDGRAYWSNAQCVEEFFGLLAFEPGEREETVYPDENYSEWTSQDFVMQNGNIHFSMQSDEKYVYCLIEGLDQRRGHNKINVALDITPKSGATTLNGAVFGRPVDFFLQIAPNGDCTLFVQEYYDMFVHSMLADYHYSNTEMVSFHFRRNGFADDIASDSTQLRVVSRAVDGIETVEYLEEHPNERLGIIANEVGRLKEGNANPNSPDYDSNTDYCISGDTVEIRIPWQLLNFYDPSKCLVIDDFRANNYQIKGLEIDRIYAAAYYDDQTEVTQFGAYELKSWDTPQFHERLKQSYYILQEAFGREKAS